MGISEMFKAMRLGSEISDPVKWKNVQSTGTVVAGLLLLGFKMFFPEQELTPFYQEIIDALVGVVTGLLLVANIIITKATSKKVGVIK